MRQLTDAVAKGVDWWNKLDQTVRDRMIQNFFKLGVAITAIGVALVVVGNALKLLANLAVLTATLLSMTPIALATSLAVVAVAGAFILLIGAMLKWKPVADGIIKTFALLTKVMTAGLIDINADAVIENFDKMRDGLGNFISDWKSLMQGFNSGNASGAKSNAGGFWSGFQLATQEAMDSLKNFQQLGYDVANQITTNLGSAFSTFVDDAFNGQLKRAQDYFADFGRSILNMFAQVIGKMVAEWLAFQAMMQGRKLVGDILALVGRLGGGLGGGLNSGAQGVDTGVYGSNNFTSVSTNTVASPYLHSGGLITKGLVRAHTGLAPDEIPIIAQTGERVLSRRQNKEYEQGSSKQQPIVIMIQSWDASDIMRNRKSIEGIFINALKKNSQVRGAVKSYG
jgi:hypothetical protein